MNKGPTEQAEQLTAKIWTELIDVLDNKKTDEKMNRTQLRIRRLLEKEVFRHDCQKSAV